MAERREGLESDAGVRRAGRASRIAWRSASVVGLVGYAVIVAVAWRGFREVREIWTQGLTLHVQHTRFSPDDFGAFTDGGRGIILRTADYHAMGPVRVYDVETGARTREVGVASRYHPFRVSPDGARMLSCDEEERALLFDLTNGKPLDIDGPPKLTRNTPFAFRPDGGAFVIVDRQVVSEYDRDGRLIRRSGVRSAANPESERQAGLAYVAGGGVVLPAYNGEPSDGDKGLTLLDAKTFEPVARGADPKPDAPEHLRASPDGRWVASASRGGLRVWQVDRLAAGPVYSIWAAPSRMEFSPGGALLATVEPGPNEARIYDLEHHAWWKWRKSGGTGWGPREIGFFPSGRKVFVDDGYGVDIMDTERDTPLARLPGKGRVTRISPDGQRVALLDAEGDVVFWRRIGPSTWWRYFSESQYVRLITAALLGWLVHLGVYWRRRWVRWAIVGALPLVVAGLVAAAAFNALE
jgi:hypothetical protein